MFGSEFWDQPLRHLQLRENVDSIVPLCPPSSRSYGDNHEDADLDNINPHSLALRPSNTPIYLTLDETITQFSASSITNEASFPIMMRDQTRPPLDPLSATEIYVAMATVQAARAILEVRSSMWFIEVVLLEPKKNIVALADAYDFPPFQPSLLPPN
ncbi:hypothetical protein ZIOFF_070801 [Zingiber officinale]|uniref:Uncharacterized protein n=1 Tax=Zingiber officinale TaxID=94328 RepID=A0A8J5C0R0_ZINOF|nr:hypothetical protein ZIOFF_070801 [Zingiber officinale]